MTPIEFTSLDLKEKIQILYRDGSFVVGIRYYGYKVNLYLLFNFYVEVFYNHKQDRIERIELMDPRHTRQKFYTDQIRLPDNLLQGS